MLGDLGQGVDGMPAAVHRVTGFSRAPVKAEARKMAIEGQIFLTKKDAILVNEPNADMPFTCGQTSP